MAPRRTGVCGYGSGCGDPPKSHLARAGPSPPECAGSRTHAESDAARRLVRRPQSHSVPFGLYRPWTFCKTAVRRFDPARRLHPDLVERGPSINFSPLFKSSSKLRQGTRSFSFPGIAADPLCVPTPKVVASLLKEYGHGPFPLLRWCQTSTRDKPMSVCSRVELPQAFSISTRLAWRSLCLVARRLALTIATLWWYDQGRRQS